jgi:hypothetical protein
MTTPTRQVIQRGSYANDGTGDTLRDAAQKINDNFANIWTDVYDGQELKPGRTFTCHSIGGTIPDSGNFTIIRSNLDVDSDQYVRISRYDESGRSFKTSSSSNVAGNTLSIWNLDSGTSDDFNLLARYEGNLQYVAATNYWLFEKTTTTFATTDGVDSGGTYFIKIDGVW